MAEMTLDRECVEHRLFLNAMDAIAAKRSPAADLAALERIAHEREIEGICASCPQCDVRHAQRDDHGRWLPR